MARSAFGSTIRTKTGRYRGRYRRLGKAYYTPTQRTKSAVQADLVRIQADILAGTWEPPGQPHSKPQDTAWTVGTWFTEWYGRQERSAVSPNTLRSYGSIFNVHILPTFKDMPLTDLTGADCAKLYEQTLATRAESTAKNVIRSFSACMSAAVEEGLLETNPVKVKGAMSRPRRRRTFHMLTASELGKLLEAMPDDTRAAGTLGSWCGLRYGEVVALERKDIDLEAGTVTVSKAVRRAPSGMLSVGSPKSLAGNRTIAIPPQAIEALEEHLERYVAAPAGSLVFHRVRGPGGFLSDRVLRRDLNLAAEKAGLPPMRFHDLRHIGLTLYGQAGATTADLMARAGHSSPETVAIYQHATVARDRELAARMGR